MKAVILAAGVGSRLGRPFPKCLSMLPTGERILGRQIRIFRQFGINEIFVVVGFKKNLIMEEFPSVYYRYNPIYYITNTSKSLCCALEFLDDDVIWSNGDVVFDEEVIREMANFDGNAVAVDRKKCGEEEVKYRADERDGILEISKRVQAPQGEAVGVNRIQKNDIPVFLQALAACKEQDYFEMGVEMLIKQGVGFSAVDISAYRCIEVDFEEDLKQALAMFAQ
jgi:choline kinase